MWYCRGDGREPQGAHEEVAPQARGDSRELPARVVYHRPRVDLPCGDRRDAHRGAGG